MNKILLLLMLEMSFLNFHSFEILRNVEISYLETRGTQMASVDNAY